VGWFARQGRQATALNWSEALFARARQSVPGATFVVGDMRALPFGCRPHRAVVSLGAVEHVAECPLAALREYHRVLRPGVWRLLPFRFWTGAPAGARGESLAIFRQPRAPRGARRRAAEWACDLMRDEHATGISTSTTLIGARCAGFLTRRDSCGWKSR
jgi:ubiquinone/menaquinone biosynthesis C-methylase UbiE